MASGNVDFPWDEFDSSAYYEHNYARLRDDDAQILAAVAGFFASAGVGPDAHGVDVGSGTNLYPVLSMLPYCRDIDLWERSTANVRWLKEETQFFSARWDPFWAVLSGFPAYRSIGDPREAVATRTRPVQGSVFDLPHAQWDIGTMFFVAESLTGEHAEFEAATRRFVGALRPGAPFAAAFMEGSEGYDVGDLRFPAVKVGVADVQKCLDDVTSDLTVVSVECDVEPLRDGYSGMILAHGRAVAV